MGSRNVRLTPEQGRQFFPPRKPITKALREEMLQVLGLPITSFVELLEYTAYSTAPTTEGPLLRISHPDIN